MKAEDLIIGDWLQDPFGNIGQVYRLDPGRVHLRLLQERPQDGEYIVHDIIPIPLTPEILKKNGILYEKQSYYYVIKDDKDLECTYYIQQVQGDWAIGVDIRAYDCSVFARIKYVHQLQHALKLCGIDKEIVV